MQLVAAEIMQIAAPVRRSRVESLDIMGPMPFGTVVCSMHSA